MSTPMNGQGRNWARESRRSAPARLANAYLSPAGAAATPHRRHPILKRVSRRNIEFNDREILADLIRKQRRRVEEIGGEDEDEDEELELEEVLSPVAQRSKLTLISSADLGLEDYDSDSSYNSFRLSLEKKDLFAPESEPLNYDQLLSAGDHFARPQSAASSKDPAKSAERDRLVTVYRAYRSSFRGDVFQDGNLSAELTIGTNRKLFQRELSKPLYRWVHVENPTMNFSTFVPIVLECPWLDDFEKAKLTSILKTARQKSERSLRKPQGEKSNYLEPEYYEETVEETIYPNFRSRRQKIENLRWMCIPYFALNDLPITKSRDATEHVFDRVAAFWQSGYVAEGCHFQVAQIWVLMLGDDFIITCSRRAIPDIPGNLIRFKTLPPANQESRDTGDRAPVIIVCDGGIRRWLLPVEKCRTWPEFTANLAEFSVDFANGWDLLYKDVKIRRTDWPRVISLAQKTSIRLVLKLTEGEEDSDDDAPPEPSDKESDSEDETEPTQAPEEQGVENVKSSNDAPSKISSTSGPKISTGNAPDRSRARAVWSGYAWHVFTLLASRINTQGSSKSLTPSSASQTQTPEDTLSVDKELLNEDSDEMDQYLRSINSRRGEREAYRQCLSRIQEDVRSFVNSLDVGGAADSHDYNSAKIHFYNAAKDIFTFFYPLNYTHEVTRKYWGAVDSILCSEEGTRSLSRFLQMLHNVRRLARVVDDLREELFSKRTPAHNQTNVPHEFIQAFMLCLMFFILYTTDQADRSSNYLARCRALLTQGKIKVIQRLQTVTLRDREAVSPLGVASLLIGQLVHDVGSGSLFSDRHRLINLYLDDLQRLTHEVHNHPLSRGYQETFVSLKSELETVITALTDQQRVLVALDNSISEGEAKSVCNVRAQKEQGREASIVESALQSTEETLANFGEMLSRVTELESWHFRIIETAKDNQEKAALAFTTVTVFFLPLTMLASVFGMNTNDIRNMNENQWLFWIIAGPLCATGLVLWLVYLGSVPLAQWFKRLLSRRKNENGKKDGQVLML